MKLSNLIHPVVLLTGPLMISFLAWLVPGESAVLRGFADRAPWTLRGALVLLAWYGACAFALSIGYRLGRSTRKVRLLLQLESAPKLEVRLFRLLLVVSIVGVTYAIAATAFSVDIVEALLNGQANDLKEGLGGQAGIATLRYTPAVAAPIGFYLWRRGTVTGVEVAIAVALLGVNALFASRLSLLLATAVTLTLIASVYPAARLNGKAVVVGLLLLAIVLTGLNYTRNSNYYSRAGITSPVEANIYQSLTYAGAPAQTSVGVADSVGAGRYPDRVPLAEGVVVLVPTFFKFAQGPDQAGSGGPSSSLSSDARLQGSERYGGTDVANNLTTNSAFADTLNDFGYWGLYSVPLSLVLAAFLYGHLVRYKSSVAAAGGVLGYGFAELWRTYLLAQGIMIYLVLSVLAGSVLLAFVGRRAIKSSAVGGSELREATVYR